MRDSGPILVPLDGSELSEGVLPYAAALARGIGAPLALLTAWEGAAEEFGAAYPSLAVDVEKAATDHFGKYLAEAAKRVTGAKCETMLRQGDASDVIPAAADEIGARMIAMATHGRSGIGRWLYGSTAGNVIRGAGVPVLAVGPQALQHPKAEVAYRRLMVPLDGSEIAEAALPVASSIAAKLGARVTLVRALRYAAQAYPYTVTDAYIPQLDEELAESAKAYLRRCEEQVKGAKADAFVVRGAVAEGLIEFVDKEAIDLVVMTTHARTGVSRAALGSVADRMLQSAAPVLLLRPEG
jgi:nucleotide-binding universal stress UspA family protein